MITTKRTAVTEGDKHMHTNRLAATIVGVLFILAAVTAILGFILYDPNITLAL
jgi:hypothetical protein